MYTAATAPPPPPPTYPRIRDDQIRRRLVQRPSRQYDGIRVRRSEGKRRRDEPSPQVSSRRLSPSGSLSPPLFSFPHSSPADVKGVVSCSRGRRSRGCCGAAAQRRPTGGAEDFNAATGGKRLRGCTPRTRNVKRLSIVRVARAAGTTPPLRRGGRAQRAEARRRKTARRCFFNRLEEEPLAAANAWAGRPCHGKRSGETPKPRP